MFCYVFCSACSSLFLFFFFNDTATTEIYTLSLHDALPIWSKWAKDQGYKIAYVAEAEIIHVHNETPSGVFNRYRREAMALRRIYPEAHFNFYDFLRLTITNIFSDIWHALREKELLKDFFSIFWFRFMQFHGTRMGHREISLITPQLRETFYYARDRRLKKENKREVEPIQYPK